MKIRQMKQRNRMAGATLLSMATFVAVMIAQAPSAHAARKAKATNGKVSGVDYDANRLLDSGIELLEQKNVERGIKALESVIQNYPASQIRFKASIALGKHYLGANEYDVAVKQFLAAQKSTDKEVIASALYHAGICYYQLSDFTKAFGQLRQVITAYPWSVYANQAYYYIGRCHFEKRQWARAVRALEMVGTSVEVPDKVDAVLAEGGRRLFVKVTDPDFVVAAQLGTVVSVQAKTASGDEETFDIRPLGTQGDIYIGSVPSIGGEMKKGDGVLQLSGGDTIAMTYTDKNTKSGTMDVKRLCDLTVKSTASMGFVDGAYDRYKSVLFIDQEVFVKVTDMDLDVSPEPDTLDVKVITEYKIEKNPDSENVGVALIEQDSYGTRKNELSLRLTETGNRTGLFTGRFKLDLVEEIPAIQKEAVLSLVRGDRVVMTYVDQESVVSPDPRTLTSLAKVFIGGEGTGTVGTGSPEVEDPTLQSKKNLIEARILLELASIFKKVGLVDKATGYSTEGLAKIEKILDIAENFALERETIEAAYNTKWDLLLAEGKMKEAVAVCSRLITLYPDSVLVDRALMSVATSYAKSQQFEEAIAMFNAIQSLPKTDLRAESAFRIAETMEEQAKQRAFEQGTEADLAASMQAYKRCAERYPESLYAGNAIDKMCEYHIDVSKNYPRVLDILEQAFVDYPDAEFLDKMLLRWVVAAYRMGRYELAMEKCQQLLSEYPDSALIPKAAAFRKSIERKLN